MLRKADLTRNVVGALVLAGGFTTAAFAQNPTFSLETVDARPGETASVRLFLSGAAADTSALNFTISVSAEDAALLGGSISGSIAPGIGSGFTYEENPDAMAGSAAVQYRGVLYPSGSPSSPPSFDATSSIPVVVLSVPVSASAAPGAEIDLVIVNRFDESNTETVTGLVGISDSSGASVRGAGEVPQSGGTRQIDASNGMVRVVEGGTTIDFADSINGWEAFQAIPSFHRALPTLDGGANVLLSFNHAPGSGIEVALASQGDFGSFGYLQTAPDVTITGLMPGMIFAHSWTLSSNASDPNHNPNVRLRAAVDGQAQIHEYMEPATAAQGQGTSIVPTAASGDARFSALANLPASVDNGERDFLLLAFDSLSFFPNGQEGNVYTVKRIEYSQLDPSGLTGAATIYSHDFSAGDTDGFTFLPNRGVPDPNNPIPGLSSSSTSDNGLEVILEGPPQAGVAGFAYGIWEKALAQWTVEAGKIVRIDYTVASSADTPVQTNVSRLRASVLTPLEGLFKFVASSIVESGGPATDTSGLPTQEGTSYTTWVNIPDALAGQTVLLSFDGYQTIPGFPFEDPVIITHGSVTLKNLTITAYDRPSGL